MKEPDNVHVEFAFIAVLILISVVYFGQMVMMGE